MTRKYQNGFTLINNSDLGTGFNFYKLVIRRKAKARKGAIVNIYLCDVWHTKESETSWPYYITENEIDNFCDFMKGE